ncbi:hypothetical protein RGU12_19590 [Fredinandcohnia sp. QZ13]|uniref:hypothetical protein n=1 Tax=Fredinandcohnia sp. QZ13 TaxID=3073144 RepID=UPI0028534C3A|nr:hypothetical protein [Fredinandcohnia sp. QZ13]MDR4889701.1 hypothetical protein [Fredinandcohnia sp. QZ13]
MNFKRVFWGYIFILLEIHLFIVDILPEPIGYYLIFSGIAAVPAESRIGNKLKKLLIGLIIISIPTVFIQQNATGNEFGSYVGISLLDYYTSLLEILKLILVFFVFQLIMEVVKATNDDFLARRSAQTFKIYMPVMLLITFSHTFAMNFSTNIMAGYLFFTIPVGLIMEIMFLVLLWKLHKHEGLNNWSDTFNGHFQ